MGRWAPLYDLLNKLLFALFLTREETVRETTVELARLTPGERVLEVACGTGSVALAAKKRVGASGEVHGIDAAAEMVAAAPRKFARAGGPTPIYRSARSRLSLFPLAASTSCWPAS